MDSCDLNCRNIFNSSSLQKHIFAGFASKSTKMAPKVNEINVQGASNHGFDSLCLQPVIRCYFVTLGPTFICQIAHTSQSA